MDDRQRLMENDMNEEEATPIDPANSSPSHYGTYDDASGPQDDQGLSRGSGQTFGKVPSSSPTHSLKLHPLSSSSSPPSPELQPSSDHRISPTTADKSGDPARLGTPGSQSLQASDGETGASENLPEGQQFKQGDDNSKKPLKGDSPGSSGQSSAGVRYDSPYDPNSSAPAGKDQRGSSYGSLSGFTTDTKTASGGILNSLKHRFFKSKAQDNSVPTGEGAPQFSSDSDVMEQNLGSVQNGKKAELDNVSISVSEKKENTPFFVYYLACFATIGGLLFGYDTGIVSGSMLLIEDYFDLNTIWKELIVSGTVGAAAVFALFAGFMCDFFGRKFTIMVASLIFVGGAILMGAAQSKEMLLGGRVVVGIGIGFASMTVPVYVAEAAPPAIRGRLVTINQLFIVIGILISSAVAGAFSKMKETGWRYMLGLAGAPGIIQFIGFLWLPESPRWLVSKGKLDQARKVLQQIRGHDDVEEEIEDIKYVLDSDKEQSGFVLGRVITTPHVRKALFVGCGLQIFQQLCGINTVIYYSATILKMAGFPPEQAIWLVMVPNTINFLSTIAGVALVERLGRKKLTVVSIIGVFISLAVLATGFQLSANFSPERGHNITEYFTNGSVLTDGCFERTYSNCESCIEHDGCGFCYLGSGTNGTCLRTDPDDEDVYSQFGRCNETMKGALDLKFSHGFCPTDYTWMAVLGLTMFVMAFAPGLGPMPWTINSEIYPMWARSTCSSIATGCNWICNLLVSLFFLTLTETITKYGAFWLFGGISFLGLLFTITFVPETKNKSLEEVEMLFKLGKKATKRRGTIVSYEKEIPPPTPKTPKSHTKL